jgi:hypothetical protein
MWAMAQSLGFNSQKAFIRRAAGIKLLFSSRHSDDKASKHIRSVCVDVNFPSSPSADSVKQFC